MLFRSDDDDDDDYDDDEDDEIYIDIDIADGYDDNLMVIVKMMTKTTLTIRMWKSVFVVYTQVHPSKRPRHRTELRSRLFAFKLVT